MSDYCQQVTICNRLGLHVRAASKLAQLATRFDATVIISHQHQQVNAKNILDLLMLGCGHGAKLHICSDGHEAQKALQAICQLIENRFNEE